MKYVHLTNTVTCADAIVRRVLLGWAANELL